ncbi:MAG: DnaD domain protein [Dehalococcoidia bacterium]|jgi:DnaD/phage-associated family protein
MSETSFKGFPARAEVTPLPNIFFTEVLPGIENLAEAKAVMQILFLLSRRKGYPRFVSYKELINDPVLMKGLLSLPGKSGDLIREALDLAVKQGILLHVPIETGGQHDDAYFINNQAERETIEKIVNGALKIPNISIRKIEESLPEQPSDIYNLYEQNIGMLTPIIAEELQEAEHKYPADWIQEAFKEAIRANVRNWKYVHSILKRWEREGIKDGKHFGDSRKERDPDRYIRGKYGHMVQR